MNVLYVAGFWRHRQGDGGVSPCRPDGHSNVPPGGYRRVPQERGYIDLMRCAVNEYLGQFVYFVQVTGREEYGADLHSIIVMFWTPPSQTGPTFFIILQILMKFCPNNMPPPPSTLRNPGTATVTMNRFTWICVEQPDCELGNDEF